MSHKLPPAWQGFCVWRNTKAAPWPITFLTLRDLEGEKLEFEDLRVRLGWFTCIELLHNLYGDYICSRVLLIPWHAWGHQNQPVSCNVSKWRKDNCLASCFYKHLKCRKVSWYIRQCISWASLLFISLVLLKQSLEFIRKGRFGLSKTVYDVTVLTFHSQKIYQRQTVISKHI